MVFSIVLCHGHYNKEFSGNVQVPDNIRLVLYTNPRAGLNDTESKFVYKQVLRNKTIVPSVLELENDDTRTLEVFPFPIIEVLRPFSIGKRKFEEMDRHYPLGQFDVYQPKENIQNFGMSFGDDFRVFCLLQTNTEDDGTLNILDSPPSDDPLIQNIKEFCTRKDITGKYSYNSIGEFLRLISRYYADEYPGRIITLMQLSCRVGDYDTVEELTRDTATLRLHKHKGKGVGYVRGPLPEGVRISHEHGVTMKDAYMYDPNPGPDAYTKGVYINKLVLSKNDAKVVELYGGGNRRRNRLMGTRYRRRHRRSSSRRNARKTKIHRKS